MTRKKPEFSDKKETFCAIHRALKTGICRLPALPPSAQAWLGTTLRTEEKRPQLWVADHVQTLDKLYDCFQTFSDFRERNILVFQGVENQDMTVMGKSLQALRHLQSGSAEPFILITLAQCLEIKVPKIGNPDTSSTDTRND